MRKIYFPVSETPNRINAKVSIKTDAIENQMFRASYVPQEFMEHSRFLALED